VLQVLVDAPGMVRGIASMRRLALTDIKLSIQRIPKKTALTKALAEASTCTDPNPALTALVEPWS
jgi:large subunit ribosomal protein L14e